MCTYVIVGKTEFPFWMRDTLVLSKPVHNGDNAIFQNPIPSFYFTWHIALYSMWWREIPCLFNCDPSMDLKGGALFPFL